MIQMKSLQEKIQLPKFNNIKEEQMLNLPEADQKILPDQDQE